MDFHLEINDMPFTPFHLGPALLIGLLALKYLDFPTFLAASIIVDIRAALVFFGFMDGPLHGILHTFVGGTVLSFALIGIVTPVRPYFDKYMKELNIEQKVTDGTVVAASFLGIYLHLLLDSFLYSDMQPFWPLVQNPLLGAISLQAVYVFCTVAALVGMAIILNKYSS